MMTAKLPGRSQRSASEILKELGITEPEDINIEAIAEYCGATIVYEPLEGCSARILGHADRAIITVNSRESSRPTQRFSGGHELGHWMRDRGKAAFACTEKNYSSDWQGDNPERRANRFAADLLLPESIFSRYAQNKEMTLDTVRRLAFEFQTSLTSTAIRLVELGSFPAMLVCNTKAGRRWFVRGSAVPEFIWPVDHPGVDTTAYELLNGVRCDVGSTGVCASDWIKHRDSGRYIILEDSIRISDGLILSLLWWKDERQLLDL